MYLVQGTLNKGEALLKFQKKKLSKRKEIIIKCAYVRFWLACNKAKGKETNARVSRTNASVKLN